MTLLVLAVSTLCELFLLRFIYSLTREMQYGPPDERLDSLRSDEGVKSGDNFRDEIEGQWQTEDIQTRGRIHLQRVGIYVASLGPGIIEFRPVRCTRGHAANRSLDQAG